MIAAGTNLEFSQGKVPSQAHTRTIHKSQKMSMTLDFFDLFGQAVIVQPSLWTERPRVWTPYCGGIVHTIDSDLN